MRHGVIRVMAPGSIMRPIPATHAASSPSPPFRPDASGPGRSRARARPRSRARSARTATARASCSPIGSTFSAKTIAATTSIQVMLITPTAKSSTISAQQQPMHQAPCSIPIRTAPARPVAPVVHDEAERRAALAQARALERGQLVDPREHDRRAGDLRSCPVPREEGGIERADQPEESRTRRARRPPTRSDSPSRTAPSPGRAGGTTAPRPSRRAAPSASPRAASSRPSS